MSDEYICIGHERRCTCDSTAVCDHCRRWCLANDVNPGLKEALRERAEDLSK